MNNSNEVKHTALYKSIYALCERAIDKIITYQQQDKLIKIPQQYIPVKEIDYLAEGFTYDWDNIQYFDFYKWGIEEFSKFLQEELSVLLEFEDAVSAIVKEFQLPEFSVKAAVLQPFLILLLKKVPNAEINFDNIDSYIQLLIDDCRRKDEEPVTWHVHLWLNNIRVVSI